MIVYAEYQTTQTDKLVVTEDNNGITIDCPTIAEKEKKDHWVLGAKDFVLITKDEEILKKLEPQLHYMVAIMDDKEPVVCIVCDKTIEKDESTQKINDKIICSSCSGDIAYTYANDNYLIMEEKD